MAVIFNAKGTTSPYFLLGKGGTTLFQGSSDPTGSYSSSAGDVWFDTNANTLKFRNSSNNGWEHGSIDITGNATISGNLTVSGTTTIVDTTNLSIQDPLLILSKDASGTPSVDSGIIVERGSSTNVGIIWDESADKFAFVNTTEVGTTAGNVSIASYANIIADEFHGDGSNLTGVGQTVSQLTDTTISSVTSGNVLKYNGSAWVNDTEGATTTVQHDALDGDGSTTAFTMETAPIDEDNLLVFVDNVLQDTDVWSLSGTTITFSEAPNPGTDNIRIWHLLSSTATNAAKLDALTGDGSTTAFSLLNGGAAYTPGSQNSLIVSVNNVIQEPGSGKDFTVSGSTITFTSAPGNSHAIWIVDVGSGVTVNTPADNSVTAAKLNTALMTASTGAFQLPVGTSAQRPGSPSAGMIRFNSTMSRFEGYDGSSWIYLEIPENLGGT